MLVMGAKEAVERLHDDTRDCMMTLYITELESVAPIKLFGGIFGNRRVMRM